MAGITLSLLMGVPTAAKSNQSPLVADTESFVETLDPSVQVSGQFLAGLMYDRKTPRKVNINWLLIDFRSLNGNENDLVCIRMTSRDGVYTAKWTTRLQDKQSSLVPVQFSTKHEDYLSSLSTDQLVVVASISKQCGNRDAFYLPTLWAETGWSTSVPPPNKYLTAFLNTDASAVFAAIKPSKATDKANGKQTLLKTKCTVLDDSVDKTNFDTVCKIPLEQLGNRTLENLSIVAQFGSSYRAPEVFNLAE